MATLTDTGVEDEGKLKVLFTQSHAHEPGATAAAMDVMHQILTGETQEGRPTKLDRARLLERMVLVIIPVGNPSGRERSPVQYWTDQFDRDTLNSYVYGRLSGDPSPWGKSPSILRRGEQQLDHRYPIATRYEQVDQNTFVEPFFAMLPPGDVDPSGFRDVCANAEESVGYRQTGHVPSSGVRVRHRVAVV